MRCELAGCCPFGPFLVQPLVSSVAPVKWSLGVLQGRSQGGLLLEQSMIRLEQFIAFSTSAHPSLKAEMESDRGKIRRKVRATINSDPSGMGIPPTKSFSKVRSIRETAGPALGTTPETASGSIRLAT